MKMVDSIWDGLSIKDEKHLGEIRFNFVRSLQKGCNGTLEAEINRSVEKLITEEDRVKFLKSHFTWKPIPQEYFTRLSKSYELTLQLKEKANRMYKQRDFLAALRGYNLAIMFAPKESEQLGIAFANRAALFMEINKFQLALRDIQLAKEHCYPSESLEKLLSRENKCMNLINTNQLSSQQSSKSAEATAAEDYRQENYMNLRKPNWTIPCAEDFIKVSYTETRGRQLITTRDIDAGTLLCSEKPYSHMLVNNLVWDTEHCHFCCRPILAGIPCTDCSFAFYCSEDCRTEAEGQYHHYEHKIYAYFHHNPTTCLLRDILSLRIIFTAGPYELFRIFEMQDPLYFGSTNNNQLLGFNYKGIYDSTSHLAVYHLISHVSELRTSHLISNCFKALLYTHIIEDHTDFFEPVRFLYSEEYSEEGFKAFVTSFIIHHMENIPFNAISMSKLKALDDSKLRTSGDDKLAFSNGTIETISYAMATYSLLSLCNHSCDPNVVPLRKTDKPTLNLITLKNVKAGEELCISYSPTFHLESTDDRIEFLKAKYNFECDCIACKKKWGPEIFRQQKKVTEESETDTELRNKLLLVDDFIAQGKFIEAVQNVKPCLMYLTKTYPSTHILTKMSQDLFKRALVWLFNSYDLDLYN